MWKSASYILSASKGDFFFGLNMQDECGTLKDLAVKKSRDKMEGEKKLDS